MSTFYYNILSLYVIATLRNKQLYIYKKERVYVAFLLKHNMPLKFYDGSSSIKSITIFTSNSRNCLEIFFTQMRHLKVGQL